MQGYSEGRCKRRAGENPASHHRREEFAGRVRVTRQSRTVGELNTLETAVFWSPRAAVSRLARRVHYLRATKHCRAEVPPAHPTYLPTRPTTHQRKPVASVTGFFFAPARPAVCRDFRHRRPVQQDAVVLLGTWRFVTIMLLAPSAALTCRLFSPGTLEIWAGEEGP